MNRVFYVLRPFKDERRDWMANFSERWILEACVLSILSRKDTYGYQISKMNELKVSEYTLYPVLRHLKDGGYLTVYSQIENARIRKIYSITPQGQEKLNCLKNDWGDYKKAVEYFLE